MELTNVEKCNDMTNQTPKQEVEWWKEWFEHTDFGGDVGEYVWVLRDHITPNGFLAEHRKMVVEECLKIVEEESIAYHDRHSGSARTPHDKIHRRMKALLNTKDDV